jgi:hypothetical protein
MLSGKLRKGDANVLVAISVGARRGIFPVGRLSRVISEQSLPSRKEEIDAEREASIARMEKLDPELVAKWRREGMI